MGRAMITSPSRAGVTPSTPPTGKAPLFNPQGAWARGPGQRQAGASVLSGRSNAGSLAPPTRQGGQSLAPVPEGQQAPSSVTGQMQNMTLNAGASVFNPSMAPTPSMAPQNLASMQMWRKANFPASRVGATNGSVTRKPEYNRVVRMSNLTRNDFKHGDIISIPFHEPNKNPNVVLPDDRFAMTREGPIYSERRMVFILWIYARTMFCLPHYTYGQTGLSNKEQWIKKEYASICDQGNQAHVNQSPHPPIDVIMGWKPMHKDSTVHLTGGLKVDCCEDITWRDRTTEGGHTLPKTLWTKLAVDAMAEPWVDSRKR
ncbi:hypothetical protein Tdes44962_MAKER08020 [Teratosphaeria destructans]|uniref:DUF6590 domain-containing protein n=1 Tax=Teratosphaeria destructans TaxID=418781 RepID=A0A9W7W522_9PEZI|nr:hypothetical protein Tdes44962_MAKER08020 [Teratosphaeria destructans]